MTLAERLKHAREHLGYTQKEMANAVSVILQTWQVYEAGKSVPGGKVFESLARLGFNVNWLLTGEGMMRTKQRSVLSSNIVLDGLARKIKTVRGDNDVEDFSDRLDVSVDELLALEDGILEPGYGFLSLLCFEYDINGSWLLEDDGPMKKGDHPLQSHIDEKRLGDILESIEEVKTEGEPFTARQKSKLAVMAYHFFSEDESLDKEEISNFMGSLLKVLEYLGDNVKHVSPERLAKLISEVMIFK